MLVGGWEWVSPGERRAYRAMVAAMERAGVCTEGRPPVWAWRGELRLLDAAMLFDPEYQLSAGFATVEFEAPDELAVCSDYGRWNDYLAGDGSWEVCPEPEREPAQVCLPYLLPEWTRDVRPLPVAGWDELDLTAPV
ncbi:hypothetical protein GCM10027445_22490 [Amycolatopsis endophytica]